MSELVSLDQLQPHALHVSILGTDTPALVKMQLNTFLGSLRLVITEDNRVLSGYYAFLAARAAGIPEIQVDRLPVTSEDEIGSLALTSLLSSDDTRIFCSQLVRLRIAKALSEIERQRARIRQQANATRTNRIRWKIDDGNSPESSDAASSQGTVRRIVASQVGMSEKTMEHGLRVLDAIDYLQKRCRIQEADLLDSELTHFSIDRAYATMKQLGYDAEMKSPDTVVVPNMRPQLRFAGLSWSPVIQSSSGVVSLLKDKVLTPLTVTDEGEDQSPANRYIIISPDHDLGTIDVRSAEICEIMEVVRKSPDWEFLLFTANLEQMNDLASILPPNCWLGFIAESGDDYVKAQNQMAVLNGIRRLLVLRPTGDSSEWVIVEKAQFCDWLAIEFAYTGPTRRARMNGEVVLRVKAYAEARSIPCYIDPELVVFLPWVQEYPPAN